MDHRWGRRACWLVGGLLFVLATPAIPTAPATASGVPTATPGVTGSAGCVAGPNHTPDAVVLPTLTPGLCRANASVVSTHPRGIGPDDGTPGHPTPAPGYHWLGGQTIGYTSSGVLGKLSVVDPDVPRLPGYDDFLAHRIMAKSCGSTFWIEIGWAEVSWRDDHQYIYSFDTQHDEWLFYDAYPIAPGDHITVAVVSVGGGTWEARVWWNGAWQTLNTASPGAGVGCNSEQYVEVYTRETMTFPPITTGGTASDVMLYPNGGSAWQAWDSSVTTIEGSNRENYNLTWHDDYWWWEASSVASVPPPPTIPPLPGVGGVGIPACAPPNPFEPRLNEQPVRSCPK